ncbi:MAG: response regulator transcription factor [Nitrospirota bacterium]
MAVFGAKVLLVDDHPLVLDCLRQLIEPDFTVVGCVHDANELLSRARDLNPDVVLLDVSLPGMSGFEAARRLKILLPAVKIIMVTMLAEAISVSEAFKAGASGYVLKQSTTDELHEAIQSVMLNKRFVSRKIDSEVRDSVECTWTRPEGYTSDLTARQREVLVLLADGRSLKDIAKNLKISIKTVEFHKENITRKLGVHTTSELIKFALAQGITSL